MSELHSTAGLASLLHDRLVEWEKARLPQEQKMIDCYNDVMRIARDDDTKGTGAAKANKAAGLFIGSTRNKVRSARAKINDALFGNGKMPFDTTPADPELEPFSKLMEKIITRQLEDMGAKQLLKSGVDTLATFGTGFVFGPFVRKEWHVETAADNSSGVLAIKENKTSYDCPYYLLGNSLDVYPDPEARNVADGLGVFWVTMESRHTVAAWKGDNQYSNVTAALLTGSDATNETGSDRASQMRANVDFWHKNDRIKVARFFGKIPKHLSGAASQGAVDDGEMIDAIVVMAGGVVVKSVKAPWSDGNSPVMDCQYEDVPHEMWGVGVADNNSPHQKVVNAAFRLFMEGKGMALLGTKSVDRSAFMPGEDFKKFPGKVYQMKPGMSPEERKTAIIDHLEADVSSGWREVIEVSEQFSDDDTAINKYTQGNDASNLNKTATGISMIMSAGSMPTKEVIQNIDERWIVRMVKALIDWNLKYLEVGTVAMLHGKEDAELWGRIKEFGKSSFMKWQATGTSSFMAKEVLLNKIRGYLELCLSNPDLAAKVDIAELLQQYWDCMEIGRESPIIKPEGEQKIPPQVQQQMEQMQQENEMLKETAQELGEKFNELDADDDGKREERLLKRYSLESARLQIILPYMPKAVVQTIAAEFGIDMIDEQQQENVEEGATPPSEAAPAPPEPEMMAEPPPGEMMEPEQPADDAGFFMPEAPAEPEPMEPQQ